MTWWRLISDAWGLFRGERDLIVRVAAPFLFLPGLAVQLLADPLPALPGTQSREAIAAWLQTVSVWGESNAVWYLLADVAGLFGVAALAILLADPARPIVGEAIGRTGRQYFRFALASVLVAVPASAGLWLFILPGLYLQARFALVMPILAAERPASATAALRRSWRLSAKIGWALFGAVVALFLLQWIALGPLVSLDALLREPGRDNPFVRVLVDAGLAAITAGYQLAVLLVGVVAWRRAASVGT